MASGTTHAVVVLLQEAGHHRLVLCEQLSKIRIRIAGSLKVIGLYIMREPVESARAME